MQFVAVHHVVVKRPHPAGPLTGNRHPPSWRAEPGSDPRPDGQRFRTGDTAAGVRSIWPLTRGPADPARRYPDRWDVMAQVLQRYSHIGCRPFSPWTVRITFRALETSSSCSTLTSLRYAIPLPHSGQLVSAGSSRCISAGRCAGNGRRWRD